MSQARFGELLGRLVPLSRHDVEEILEEQSATSHRFGEIALSWGLCQPEHVWQAWCDQLLTQVQKVDLDRLGVDSQAAALVSRDTAVRLNLVPIRILGNHLVVAMSDTETDTARAAAELKLITDKTIRFVFASQSQVQKAIDSYYTASPAAA
jgi:hypothetical protein